MKSFGDFYNLSFCRVTSFKPCWVRQITGNWSFSSRDSGQIFLDVLDPFWFHVTDHSLLQTMSNSQHSQQKPRRCLLVLLHVTSFCLCKTRASGVDRVVMFRIGVSSVLMAHSFSFDAEKGDRSIVGDSPICQAHSGCQLLILRPCFTTFNTHLLTCIAATPVCSFVSRTVYKPLRNSTHVCSTGDVTSWNVCDSRSFVGAATRHCVFTSLFNSLLLN